MPPNQNAKPRKSIVFIAGTGRNGSTLVSALLSKELKGFSTGELRYIWDRGMQQDRLCGCGQHYSQCAVWKGVVERSEAYGGLPSATDGVRERSRLRNLHLMMGLLLPMASWLEARAARLSHAINALYGGIRDQYPIHAIIDSSKYPSWGFALTCIEDVDVHVIHLIRDPRAVCYSWLNPKFDPGKGRMMRKRSLKASLFEWNMWNLLIERHLKPRAKNYILVRYEDFTGNPNGTIGMIKRSFFGSASDGCDGRLPDEKMQQELSMHPLSGNPIRFDKEEIVVKIDTRWKKGLGSFRMWIIVLFSWPLMLRYKYIGGSRDDR